jgi:peptidoglycan/xylan/chitin deacetylase (PgdA/CDA1 family)
MSGPAILMYHRVGSSDSGDPWGMTVSPHNFEVQVRWIASARTPLPLSEFARRLTTGTLPPDAIAVTFDDAYFDNLSVAKPILDRYHVPATLFVAPGFLGKAAFWWDRLQHMVWTSPALPATLDLTLGGRQVAFVFDAEDRQANALAALWAAIRDLDEHIRDETLDSLKQLLCASDYHNAFRPMTRDELKQMASGAVEIGAHTVHHAWLPALETAAKQREVLESLALCTELAGYAPQCFSYPYGAFDAESREIVQNAGFLAACTVAASVVSSGSDPLALPRITAPDNMERFKRAMGMETRSDPPPPSVGNASIGDLRRTSAISTCWGGDRGKPVDRRYIEEFLLRHSPDMQGRVLEVKDPGYGKLFGGSRIKQLDVVDIDRSNPVATVYADLQNAPELPDATYDCVILTQVLPVVFDVQGVVDTVHRILAPRGVLLLTAPGPFSPPFPGDDYENFYWAYYPRTIRTLLERHFAPSEVHVEAHGNLATCAAFIAGLAEQDLSDADYAHNDDHYPLIVAARAQK